MTRPSFPRKREATPAHGAGLAAVLVVLATSAAAQDAPPAVITQQRGGTYTAPPERVDPLFTPLGPDRPSPEAIPQPPLQLRLALDLPLRGGGTANLGAGTQGSTAASPTLQAQLRWTPLRDRAWFAQLVFYRYLVGARQQPWHPDFSYAFGHDDPAPDTWRLVYANYTGTRLRPEAGEGRFNFPQGQWTLGWRFGVDERLARWFLVGDGDAATCSANGHVVPRYTTLAGGALRSGKTSLSLDCHYTRPGGWFVDLALYAWPDRGQQQPWDPDYTYGFGWASGGPGDLVVQYNNYSGNRFPGRARGAGEGTFRSGSVSVSWSLQW